MSAIQQAIAAMGTTGPVAYRYWRLYMTQNGGDPGYFALEEMQLRQTVGVPESMPAIAWTVDQPYFGSYSPALLYDGVLTDGTGWITPIGSAVSVKFDLGTPRMVKQLALAPQNGAPARAPTSFYLLASNVDITGPYTFMGIYTGATYASGTLSTFPVPDGV